MGTWVYKKIVRKAKVITIPTRVNFKLSDYTKGVAWGEHTLKVGIVNMEHGYDTYGVEVQPVRVAHDTYYTRILRKRDVFNPTENKYSIPYNLFGQIHTLINEPNLGGVTIHIYVHNCVPPLEVLVLLNDSYWVINQVSHNESFVITGTLKIPPTSNYNSNLKVQLRPLNGTVTTATRADIGYYRFYGVEEEISGTTNVIACEVE